MTLQHSGKGRNMAYSKADVRWHSDGFGPRRPAVNVKHWPDLGRDVEWSHFDGAESAFHCWVRHALADDHTWHVAWMRGAESCWEMVESDAQEIFGSHVRVWSQGRSGGWAVVDGLPDFDTWDATTTAKWGKFERYAQASARDLAYQMVSTLYLNEWEAVRAALSSDVLSLV
jgi:hypothetical protein